MTREAYSRPTPDTDAPGVKQRNWSLYRCRDVQGRLLYLGTTSGRQRWAKHAEDSHWWALVKTIDVEHFPTRDDALAAEREAIASEQPMHNVQLAAYAKCMQCRAHLRWIDLDNAEAEFVFDGLRYSGAWFCERCIDYDTYTAPPRGAGIPSEGAAPMTGSSPVVPTDSPVSRGYA